MSQISDAKLNFYAGSLAHHLVEDRLFVTDFLVLDLAVGASFVFGFELGTFPVIFHEMFLKARSSSQVLIEMREDSIYSGGTDLQLFNANRALNRSLPPFVDFKSGVTEDTPGTTIRRITLLGSTDKKDTSTAGVTGGSFGLVLRPESINTYTITNQDPTDAMDFDLQISVGVSE